MPLDPAALRAIIEDYCASAPRIAELPPDTKREDAADTRESCSINAPPLAASAGNRLASSLTTNYREQWSGSKWILFPVAVPGSGKSAIVAALAHLFNFVVIGRPGDQENPYALSFEERVKEILTDHDVVIVDRNNYRFKHRQLIHHIGLNMDCRPLFFALNWNLDDLPLDEVHSLCFRRTTHSRRATPNPSALWDYLSQREPLLLDEAHAVVDLRLDDDLIYSLLVVVDAITSVMSIPFPSHDTIIASITATIGAPGRPSAHPTGPLGMSIIPQPRPAPPPTSSHLITQSTTSDQVETVESLMIALQSAERDRLIVARDFVTASGTSVTSWKFPDPEFYRLPRRLPILSRGLWTQQVYSASTSGNGNKWRIVSRGYDKFFNIGETSWSTWHAIRLFTTGPYHVTLKSDGCLIMVSALTEDTVLVTSKYSSGSISSMQMSHAEKGEQWLHKHLTTAGKSVVDLAACLWQRKWTLLCELCDRSFEDHIIPVTVEESGLRLHGINARTVSMKTEDPNIVYKFAREWGLLTTPYTTVGTFAELTPVVSRHPVMGTWGLRAIEGFVVRAVVKTSDVPASTLERLRRRVPPYANGASVFFKVKFDHPYLLYLAFREVTKVALGFRIRLTVRHDVLNRDDVKTYFMWVQSQVAGDRAAFRHFGQNRGVISLRESFLRWLPTDEGIAVMSKARAQLNPLLAYLPSAPRTEYRSHQRWLILPIGLPGSGKTTISSALSYILSVRHVEFDTMKTRNSQQAKSIFRERIQAGLRQRRIVIADGRNHRTASRQSLKRITEDVNEPVKILALHWEEPKTSIATAQRICAERLIARDGLHAGPECDKAIWRFLAESDPLQVSEVDAVVSVRYEDSLEQCIASAVHGIQGHLDLDLSAPLEELLWQQRLRVSELGCYNRKRPHSSLAFTFPAVSRSGQFVLLPEVVWSDAIEHQLSTLPRGFIDKWTRMCATSRSHRLLANTPIVITYGLGTSSKRELRTWAACGAVRFSVTFDVVFQTIIYTERIIAAVVADIRPRSGGPGVADLMRWIRGRTFHCILGRSSQDVSPREGQGVIQSWQRGAKGLHVAQLVESVCVTARVHELFL